MASNYAQNVVDAIQRELPDVAPELAKYYALLAFTRGVETTE